MFTYTNPVYPGYFADPFVWRVGTEYFAIGTAPPGATLPGLAFPLLHSTDFSHWRFLGGALELPAWGQSGECWAPEIAATAKGFFLYYSIALHELRHQLRVAFSEKPEGPYRDVQALMKNPAACPFAIDAHPFQDSDGSWYLFYARDFLDGQAGLNAGTALVADRLIDMTRLAGDEKVMLRSKHAWHLFKAQRPMYGRILDWHTLEGPCVRKHDDRYYLFFSGGCYENETYGIDYAVSHSVLGPYHDTGGESGPRILKTVPHRVIGPGHHSIVVGPDSREFIAYHAWDPKMTARRFCIDPLLWTPDGPRCAGPTPGPPSS